MLSYSTSSFIVCSLCTYSVIYRISNEKGNMLTYQRMFYTVTELENHISVF